jgi:UDP-N-acetylmuramoyl-tripeptide--D-alanyl-D-alanine ligase
MSAMFTLAKALPWIPGGTLVGDGKVAVERVHSDTRTLRAGDLFVAIRGERFDANDFLAEAQAKGAAAAIAQRGRLPAGFAGIEVDDSKLALGSLAAGWRAQFNLPLIAVTGSNGKTTVTQMIASILRAWQPDAMLATQGNFNNDIGLPLQLLRLRGEHRVAAFELGMNHPGEIGYLAGIARPTVALVNNAQREHQEFMASVEAVARENGSVFAALAPSGVAVFPAGDQFTPLWMQLAGARACMTFGAADTNHGAAGADIVLAGSEWQEGHWQVGVKTPAGPVAYRLHIAGRHNVRNSLAAVACALAAGVPLASIAQGLESFEPVKGRSRAFAIELAGRTITVVDDTYNSNPDSARAAIDVLAELPGPRLLVLGDMGEVGNQGPQFHAEVGEHARARRIEQLFTLGEQSAAMNGRHFDAIEPLNAAVLAQLPRVASVLVKGSRFMRMERVVEAIAREGSGHAA